jgi:predicted DNA-binding protein (MmcQ/YjbR family)
VKCEPAVGEALRAQYASITPRYHLKKRHWITLTLDGEVPAERVRELVLDSYEPVAPKKSAVRTAAAPAGRAAR